MISVVPELIDDMVKSLPTLLLDNDHGVLISGSIRFSILRFSNPVSDFHFTTLTQLHSKVSKNGP